MPCTTTIKAAAAALVALQRDTAGALAPIDADASTRKRVKVAFEAMAPNTRRSYANALAAWGRWVAAHGVSGLSPAPVCRRFEIFVAALLKIQALGGALPTARDQIVIDTMSGLARKARPPRQVGALTTGVLAAINETACIPRIGRGGLLEYPEAARRRGLVDIALCRVLSDAGLRRSEAAALVWDDVDVWDDGSGRLTVRRSKTDAGARTVYVTPAAVAALAAIRPEDGDVAAPVFGLSVSSISRRVKAAAMAAGMGPSYSGHSGRVGDGSPHGARRRAYK